MKDYTTKEEEKKTFILKKSINSHDNVKSIEIITADGKKYGNININEDGKINDLLEYQGSQAANHYSTFSAARSKAGRIVKINAGALAVILSLTYAFVEPEILRYLIYVASLAESAIPLAKYIEIASKLKELNKIVMRNENKDKLDNLEEHPNALNGVRGKVKNYINNEKNQGRDPFRMENINKYNLKDLKKILEYIDGEEQLGLEFNKQYKVMKK